MSFIDVQNRHLEYEFLPGVGADAPTIVFLHEGLGSIEMWRDFPAQVLAATGCRALVYSRYGYGRSEPLAQSRRVDFMHTEALRALPELLDKLDVERPILFGHSDGASIALIHAGGVGRGVTALILLAPHVFVEPITIENIEAAKRAYRTTNLPTRLGRYHANVESAFWGWNDIWLDPAFRSWNIETFLPHIACPVLAIQGEDDEYGTMEQIGRIQRGVPHAEVLKLSACGHSPHRDQPDAVIRAIQSFLKKHRLAPNATVQTS